MTIPAMAWPLASTSSLSNFAVSLPLRLSGFLRGTFGHGSRSTPPDSPFPR